MDRGSLAATDGNRLVVFSDVDRPSSDAAAPGHQGKVWTRAHVETLVKVAKATKADHVRLELDKAGQGFPPAWQVVPGYGMEAGRDSIGVNPDYLADLCKVTKACEANCAELAQAKGELDPLGFMVKGHEHTARVVIMPVRK